MQLDAQTFLRLAKKANEIAFFDIEGTGLRGDYNSVLCTSVASWDGYVKTFAVERPGADAKVVKAVKAYLESFAVWVTYYGKMYDVPMLNTRLFAARSAPIAKRHHVDLYFTLRSALLTARRSQGHLLLWAGTPEQKQSVSAEVWNTVLADPKTNMPKMIKRCESDALGLRALFKRSSHLIQEITR